MSSDNKSSATEDRPLTSGKKKWEFERDRCALIVIDMQNDFVADGGYIQVEEARNQIPKIKRLIEKCRELSVPVIYTLQRTDPVFNPLDILSRPILKDGGMREGTWGIEVVPELTPQPNDLLVWKRRFSAFFQTELELLLKNVRGAEKSVDTLIICGTSTNVCCESTARDAFFRDYKVVFGSDINSTRFEEAHKATLFNIELFFGRVMDCEAIIKALEEGKG